MKYKLRVGLLIAGILYNAVQMRAALIPPLFADSVVVIGRYEARGPGQPAEWVALASGFFYGVAADNEKEPAKHMYAVYLVTNRHVFANQTQLVLRLNHRKRQKLLKRAATPCRREGKRSRNGTS